MRYRTGGIRTQSTAPLILYASARCRAYVIHGVCMREVGGALEADDRARGVCDGPRLRRGSDRCAGLDGARV